MADNKKPCAPAEEESRDYDRIGLHMYGDNNPTREAEIDLVNNHRIHLLPA